MRLGIGIVALLLNLAGYVPYIRDIFRKIVRPHKVTWGIWTILTTIAAVNQIRNGGGYSSIFFVSTTCLVAITFLLSLKYGQAGFSLLDKICLASAIALLIYWVTVQDTRVSTLLAVIIDALGAIPTLVKTYKHPETETYIQWTLAAIGGLLTMAIVPRLDWALLIYPAYVLLMNSAIVATKYTKERMIKV